MLFIASCVIFFFFFFSSRRRHTRSKRDWSSDVCSSDLLEYRPSNRRVVHHALCATDFSGNPRKLDQADPLPGYKGSLNIPGVLFPGSLSAWTPGRDPMPLPEGISMPWKKGADLVMQLHLHPSGKPEVEQSSLGFYLTDEPPRRSMVDVGMIDRKIDIPPGDRAFKTHDNFQVPVEMEVMGIF